MCHQRRLHHLHCKNLLVITNNESISSSLSPSLFSLYPPPLPCSSVRPERPFPPKAIAENLKSLVVKDRFEKSVKRYQNNNSCLLSFPPSLLPPSSGYHQMTRNGCGLIVHPVLPSFTRTPEVSPSSFRWSPNGTPTTCP